MHVGIHECLDGKTLRLGVETEMGSIDGFFDGSNYSRHKVLLSIVLLRYTGGKVLVYAEGIKLEISDGKGLVIYFEN